MGPPWITQQHRSRVLSSQRYGLPSLGIPVKRHRTRENPLSESEGHGGEAQHVRQELQHVKGSKIRLFDKIAVRPVCLYPRGTALPAHPPRHGVGVRSPTNTNSTKRMNRSYHELADKPASSHAKLVIRAGRHATGPGGDQYEWTYHVPRHETLLCSRIA